MALLEQLFSTGGDGSGVTEMGAPAARYRVAPPPGYIYEIHRINACVEDETPLGGDLYSGIAALTNGINITSKRGDEITLHTPQPIKKVGHWGLLAGVDMQMTDFLAANNDIFLVRWSITKYGGPIILYGNNGDYMEIDVRDDLSNISSHIVQAQGVSRWTG